MTPDDTLARALIRETLLRERIEDLRILIRMLCDNSYCVGNQHLRGECSVNKGRLRALREFAEQSCALKAPTTQAQATPAEGGGA